MNNELYEDWLTEADEFQDGYDALTAQLAEDEQWAKFMFEAFHGSEV